MATGAIFSMVCVVAACAFAGFISLRNAKNMRGDRYLCGTCKFNSAELCHRSQRPKALVCLAYSQGEVPVEVVQLEGGQDLPVLPDSADPPATP